jgi:hypothetical protein
VKHNDFVAMFRAMLYCRKMNLRHTTGAVGDLTEASGYSQIYLLIFAKVVSLRLGHWSSQELYYYDDVLCSTTKETFFLSNTRYEIRDTNDTVRITAVPQLAKD